MTADRPLSIYIHIPFCARHCAYCDFNTYVEKQQSSLVQDTVDAICADIEGAAQEYGDRIIETIFFGGGTPTFLSGDQITRIVETIKLRYVVAPQAEISSEANPGSSDAEKFAFMRAAGFNRLSIGIQSFNDDLLVRLDRFHSVSDAERAVLAARYAGFTNINLDLMFGLPGQTLELWQQSLYRACALAPEHLSLYALTLEPGTLFERRHAGGKLPLPDEETELQMYEGCIDQLSTFGYEHYEVSNFALPGYRCRHNMVYWRNNEYLGFGPGAVSYISGRRYKRERLPARYIDKIRHGLSIEIESEALDTDGAIGETMMLGLRLRDGLDTSVATARYGIDPMQKFETEIGRLAKAGLLEQKGRVLRLTHQGLLLANTVLSEFVAA